jgi:hypothetical protein
MIINRNHNRPPAGCAGCAARDLVVGILQTSEARLQAHLDSLLGLLADQAVRCFELQRVASEQIVARIHAEARLEQVQRRLRIAREAA